MSCPEIVAEISANHNGSIERALALINAAKEAGADAVKLQAYRSDLITIDHDGPGFMVDAGPWKGRRLIDLYREAETPRDWLPQLFHFASLIGIPCFASVFAKEDVDFLEGLGCPRYKIASFEIVDTPLIRYAAATGKPLVISTGMAHFNEVDLAVLAAGRKLTLLHCVSAYPTDVRDADLGRMGLLRDCFKVPVGLSDHTLGIAVPVAATALGASMIEKHLTLSRADGGPDASFSLEPAEFKAMVAAVRDAAAACSMPERPAEPYRGLRRSLYAVTDIAEGESVTERNVRSIRPGHGLAPRELPSLLGRKAVVPIARGTPMAWDLF